MRLATVKFYFTYFFIFKFWFKVPENGERYILLKVLFVDNKAFDKWDNLLGIESRKLFVDNAQSNWEKWMSERLDGYVSVVVTAIS